MDKFIKTNDFNINPKTLLGRETLVNSLQQIIKKGNSVCIYGPPGVGRTYVVTETLIASRTSWIQTNNLEIIKKTDSYILLDDYEYSKEFSDYFKANPKKKFILITNSLEKIDFCDCLEISKLSNKIIQNIGKLVYPNIVPSDECAKLANGNIHNYLFYIQCSDKKDIYLAPKELVKEVLSTDNPIQYVGEYFQEHGFTWGVVHDNYPDSNNLDMDTAAQIADSMSLADNYDNRIYEGDWNSIDFFTTHGIVEPSVILKGGLKNKQLRPGSCWTKFNNFKMRQNKLKHIRLDKDTILIIFELGRKDTRILKAYNIESSDIDTINHLRLENKLKQKEITMMKKRLANFVYHDNA